MPIFDDMIDAGFGICYTLPERFGAVMQLKNIRIVPIESEPIANGYVAFNQTITAFGDMRDFPGGEALDCSGLTLYPGFVDAHTHLGMCEDSLGFEGDDLNEETAPATPFLRALDAVNPQDRCFSEALAAGITCVLTGPGSANPIAGQIIAMKTYGELVDEMVVKAPAAMKLALGENPKRVYNEKNESPITRMATAAIIREQLLKAREYYSKQQGEEKPDFDAALEALSLLFSQKLPVHIHAHRADDIATALRLANEFGLEAVIVHCTQGGKIAGALAKAGVKALCGPLLCDRCKPELSGATPENPGILSRAGVKTAIITDHPETPLQYLALTAGLAVREGMDYDTALRAITLTPAEICGIADRVGSIAVGKDADLCAFDCDPLTLAAKPRLVIAGGTVVSAR